MTVITSISDRTNDSWYTFKSVKKRSSFTKKENSALTEHACLTNHTNGWDKLKVSPLISVTTNAFFGSLPGGISSPPSWWWQLTTWGLFTPRQKKGQLISEQIEGPLLAAIRSSLMKALDRSVETSGLWIITSRLHSLIKSFNQSSIKPCLIVYLVALWTLIYQNNMTWLKKQALKIWLFDFRVKQHFLGKKIAACQLKPLLLRRIHSRRNVTWLG